MDRLPERAAAVAAGSFPALIVSLTPLDDESGGTGTLVVNGVKTGHTNRAGYVLVGAVDVDPPVSPQTLYAQIAAGQKWFRIEPDRYAELKEIRQPTLVVNGKHDVMIPTINSFIMSQHIPNAQLIIYPDSGHGALFQYPELFLAHSRLFLDN